MGSSIYTNNLLTVVRPIPLFFTTIFVFCCVLVRDNHLKVLDVLGEELPCITYDGWGNLTPSGYFKFDLGGWHVLVFVLVLPLPLVLALVFFVLFVFLLVVVLVLVVLPLLMLMQYYCCWYCRLGLW